MESEGLSVRDGITRPLSLAMQASRFSIRTSLGLTIVLMGVVGLVLALITGQMYRSTDANGCAVTYNYAAVVGLPSTESHPEGHVEFHGYDAKGNRIKTTTTRTLADVAGPSMRFVMDWSDVDGFTLSRHLGQSGNPLSPHFADFLAPHLAGESWPMPFTRAKVEARAVQTLRIVPAR